MKELDYYQDQLERLKGSEYGFTIQVRDANGNKTHWMQLNRESAMRLIGFFFRRRINERAG